MSSASPLSPTFYGHIASTQDALILFEACLNGSLNHVARRPHDRERASLIKSGNVFIYEEHSSGIKRWTDGVPWSPSRILGNFLVYRELERPFPPGEKKRAMKRSKRSPGISKQEPYSGSGLRNGYNAVSAAAAALDTPSGSSLNKETERSLIGSLVDSYGFKEEGLVKKTVSVTVGAVSHHLVSYYTVADVMNNKLGTPSKDQRFQDVHPRPDLVTKQNFRTPIDEVEPLDRMDDRAGYPAFPYARNGYEMTNQSFARCQVPPPLPSGVYTPTGGVYSNYGINTSTGPFESVPANTSNSGFGSQYSPPPGVYAGQRSESYGMNAYRPPQRLDSAGAINADPGRNPFPTSNMQIPRRPSNYDQNNPIVPGLPDTSIASKITHDPSYSSQGYYGNLRDGHNHPNVYGGHRALPTPGHPPSFERAPGGGYGTGGNPEMKDSLWQVGSSNPGSGHFVPHQPWAGADTT